MLEGRNSEAVGTTKEAFKRNLLYTLSTCDETKGIWFTWSERLNAPLADRKVPFTTFVLTPTPASISPVIFRIASPRNFPIDFPS
jgi:hypothetical protein